MKKSFVGLLLVGAIVLVFAGTAAAAKPYMETDTDSPFTFTSCGFPVLITPAAHDFAHLFIFSDGDVLASGPFVATATNLDSGKSVMINISGIISFVPHSDGSATVTFDGPTLFLGTGIIVNGRRVRQFDANGNLVSQTTVGMQEDLCAELAGP
jgi:hypothetical protein